MPFPPFTRGAITTAVIGAAAVTAACASARGTGRPDRSAASIDLTAIDSTCAPCQDFYSFANGAWLARTEVPADKQSIGTVDELFARAQRATTAIIEEEAMFARAGRPGTDPDRHALGAFYDACLDTAAVDSLRLRPIRPVLDAIDSVRTPEQFMEVAGRVDRFGSIFLSVGPAADPRNSSRYVTVLAFLGGLGLPDRDYYLRQEPRYETIRHGYVEQMERMFELFDPALDGAADAHAVFALETELARRHFPTAAARDPRNTSNVIPIDSLARLTPSIPWQRMFAALKLPAITEINARYPAALRGLDSLFRETPLSSWKALLRWNAITSAAPALGKETAAVSLALSRLVTGVATAPARETACADETRRIFPDIIAREYVRRHFSPAVHERVSEMTENIVAVLRDEIARIPASDTTRRAALEKLDGLRRRIGHPKTWRGYPGLTARRGEYFANRVRAAEYASARSWSLLTTGTDRDAWVGSPSFPGGSYQPPLNQITIQAAFLQPPFFDPAADEPMNYGAIGVIIGHELTHAFDVTGRQFDPSGNQRNWWTAIDDERYRAFAQTFVEQYSAYPLVEDRRINGQSTLGENISDYGGMRVAFLAMQRALAGKSRRVIDGFTPEQRFFLANARLMRTKYRPEALLQSANGTHSPMKWRVNGPMSRMPEFAAAWGCTQRSAMVR